MTALHARPDRSGSTSAAGSTHEAPTSPTTVMILGASLLQVPMIRRARELGMRTVVVDLNPDAPGSQLADEFHAVSTNDIEAVVTVARQHKVDGVTTVGTDMPVRSLAAAAQELGLPGLSADTALTCTDKALMVKAFAHAHLPHPAFATVSSPGQLDEAVTQVGGFPCLLKPLDSSGSRGVIQVDTADRLGDAFRYAAGASRSGQVLVEELLRGPEISCEVLCIGGRSHVIALTDKATTGTPHFIETGHTQPAVLEASTIQAVHHLVQDTVQAVGITDGPAHIEMILTAAGPRLVELGARLAGDFVASHLVPLATDIDLLGLVLRQACGEQIPPPVPRPSGGAIRFLSSQEGTVAGFSGVRQAQDLPGVEEVMLLVGPGHRVTGLHSSTDRLGVVIAKGADPAQAAHTCDTATSLITIEVQP